MVYIFFGIIALAIAGGYISNREMRRQRKELLVDGLRLTGKFAAVGRVTESGHRNTTTFFEVPIELALDEHGSLSTRVVVSQGQLSLMQPGAPCVVMLDRTNPQKLVIVKIANAFHVLVDVRIPSDSAANGS